MNELIIMSPSPEKQYWRFRRSTANHRKALNLPKCESLCIKLPGKKAIFIDPDLNYNKRRGGAISSPKISEWIISRNLTHNVEAGEKPKRLLFEWTVNGAIHTYKYIGTIADYQRNTTI